MNGLVKNSGSWIIIEVLKDLEIDLVPDMTFLDSKLCQLITAVDILHVK